MIQGTIAGTLGGDAEIKHTQSGDAFASFSVASNSKVKGEKTTTWVRCTMWGKRGAELAQYLTKGGRVTVVGALSMRSYEQAGETRTSLECNVSDVALMSSKRDDEASRAPKQAAPQPQHDDEGLPF